MELERWATICMESGWSRAAMEAAVISISYVISEADLALSDHVVAVGNGGSVEGSVAAVAGDCP